MITGQDVQDAVDALAKVGGGTVYLPLGIITVAKTLRLPANVRLESVSALKTCLAVRRDRVQVMR